MSLNLLLSTGLTLRALELGGSAAFNPATLPNLALWLDASDTSTITESGGAVSQWDDKSGNGNHATQGTGANQPTTGTRTVNGLNVLDFDGSNDFLILPSSLYDITSTDVTIFTVTQSDADVDSHILGGSSGKLTFQYKTTNNLRWGLNNGGFDDDSIGDTTELMALSMRREGTGAGTNAARKNGVLLGLASSQDTTLTSLWLARSPSYGQPVNGVFCEVILFYRALTVEEQNQIGVYLSDKWGITWTEIT